MIPKRKPAPRKTSPGADAPAPIELIVRRGALRRFDALKRKTSELPVVVVWDKRKAERRTGASQAERNRRSSDRRQKEPFTWELADFVVVEKGPMPAPGPGRTRKNTSK